VYMFTLNVDLVYVSALFGLIGIIIYGAEVNKAEDEINAITPGTRITYTLDWSFALCTVSAILATIAVILIAVGSRLAKR